MLKFCNGCKRDLEIDKNSSYKKSTCKECVNKKVECEYCIKEFNSNNLSKHIKQIHASIFNINSSKKINSISNSSLNNDSTSKSRSEQTNDIIFYNLSDSKIFCDFIDTLKKNISYDEKDKPKTNSLLNKARIIIAKLYERTISQQEKRQFITITNKLKKLYYFKK